MAYYIRRRKTDGKPDWATACLVEVNSKEEVIEGDHLLFERETGQGAHRWVREGLRHETPLYIDADNRIRYAKDTTW